VYRDRLFFHFNNGTSTRPNSIFLVELDPDLLTPLAPARPLVLDGPRQTIEKNWMLFDHDGELFAIYSIEPHVVLKVNLEGDGPVHCQPLFYETWSTDAYANHYGALWGGTPPVRIGDTYFSFFHSFTQSRLLSVHRLLANPWRALRALMRKPQRQYLAGFYAYSAAPPFAPLGLIPRPVLIPPRASVDTWRRSPYSSAVEVVYPCGAALDRHRRWIVSYGLYHLHCCVALIEHEELLRHMLWISDG